MLELKNIIKIYEAASENSVQALKGISLKFRKSEFVSILGPSGCGKTTLLNIIGGLDRYTSGDLIINDKSTKEYHDLEWDTYRNHSIGFVFQSYNLIPHLTILENVELTMTLGGVSKEERRKIAIDALVKVGLKDKINKKPNQLSGGQMQRVSIARALAGKPDIILADEPTGALDTETSESVMQLLKEISKDKLIIMVTHNPDLAYKYSDRIIKMLDGEVVNDSNPYDGNEVSTESNEEVKYNKKYSSMSFFTALRLSGKNLLSKKRRTIITCLAASIGIIGIAVVLSVSSGMKAYIDKTMLDSATFNYVTISKTTTKGMITLPNQKVELPAYPENTTGIYPYDENIIETVTQKLDSEFISFLEDASKDKIVDITYTYNITLNILTKKDNQVTSITTNRWSECMNNTDYIGERYSVLASIDGAAIPNKINEVALVVDEYNRLSTSVLSTLGISYPDDLSEIKYDELLGKEFKIILNNDWYKKDTNGIFCAPNISDITKLYDNENNITVKITSILRQNKDISDGFLSKGIVYSPELTKEVIKQNQTSEIALAQAESKTIDVTTGKAFLPSFNPLFPSKTYESALENLGYTNTPTKITIYPIDINSKNLILNSIDDWNIIHKDTESEIIYLDMSSFVTSMLGTIVDIITYVLMAFSIVSLVISSIMIAIIIYASVIERTREIGVLRSIGARKKDVKRVFEAEAILLGVTSGIIAIVITIFINIAINIILTNITGVSTIANLTIPTAISLILLSAILLLIASLIPASIAAKKDPAVALRTE